MFASLGSMLNIDFGDLIDYLGGDPYTKSIVLYMEGVGSARKIISATRGFARTKPIIVLKPGKYVESAKAARSHTGALAGKYAVYAAAFKRCGAVRVDEIENLFNCASVLDSMYLPAGPRLAIISNGGGPGVMATDSVIDNGGELVKLSDELRLALCEFLPPYWSNGNPIDLLGDADVERYDKTIRACIRDPEVDGIIVIYTPQGTAQPSDLAEKVIKIAEKKLMPILTVWMGGKEVGEARKLFYTNNIPTFSTPEQAIKTYMYMHKYKRNLELLYETPEELPVFLSLPTSHLKLMMQKVIGEGRTVLTPEEVDKFLDAYGIPIAESYLVKNVDEAAMAASRVGFSVVLKVVLPDIVHKSDIGGVILDVNSEDTLRTQYQNLIESVRKAAPQAKIHGVYVQKAKKFNHELILVARKDRDFGTVILFGHGGTGVRVLPRFFDSTTPLKSNPD